MSDNGPQYASSDFRQFAQEYKFEHLTSSPGYPQSNGQAEHAVGIIKGLLNRTWEDGGDIYLALLQYRKTPR